MSVFIKPGFKGTLYPLTTPRIGWRAISGTITASNETPGFDAEFADSPLTYNAWKPVSGEGTWEIQATAAETVSYCGVGAHTMGTEGGTVAVQYYNGTTWVTLVTGSQTDNTAMLFLFPEVSAARWRVSVESDGGPKLGNIRFGRVMEFPRLSTYAPEMPISEAQQYSYVNNHSARGAWLSRTKVSEGLSFSVTVDYLSEQFAATEWADFRAHCNDGDATFYIAPFPAKYPGEVAYAYSDGTVAAERVNPNYRQSRTAVLNCIGAVT